MEACENIDKFLVSFGRYVAGFDVLLASQFLIAT